MSGRLRSIERQLHQDQQNNGRMRLRRRQKTQPTTSVAGETGDSDEIPDNEISDSDEIPDTNESPDELKPADELRAFSELWPLEGSYFRLGGYHCCLPCRHAAAVSL